MAELGSGVPTFGMPPNASDNWEYVEDDADPGTLALWKLSDLVRCESATVDVLRGCI
jgi:hypothetical protein